MEARGMSLPAFEKLRTGVDNLDRLQDRLLKVLSALLRLPLLDGQLVEDLALTSGLNNLNHGLGRSLRGYLVVRASADVRLWDDDAASSAPQLFHRIQASAPATVTLWVF
jgi:hypothetical protein